MNQGDELRSLVKHFDENENEIARIVGEIETNGIDLSGIKKHARFDENGFAHKASKTNNV